MLTQFVCPVECVYRAHLSLTLGGKFSFKHCMVAQSLAFIKNCVLFGFLSTGAMIHISSNTPSWLWELQNFQISCSSLSPFGFFLWQKYWDFLWVCSRGRRNHSKTRRKCFGGDPRFYKCVICAQGVCALHSWALSQLRVMWVTHLCAD